jgi:hypothetical protein
MTERKSRGTLKPDGLYPDADSVMFAGTKAAAEIRLPSY